MYINRLQEILEKDNITLTSLCKLVGVDRSTLGKYISGYLIMPLKHLNTICNYFNISLDYSFGLTNKKTYSNYNSDINIKLFIQRLKEFRKERKVTQEKLAEDLGCSRSAISEYENNKRLITTYHIYDICKIYNISADYLLGKIDNPKYIK